MLNFDTVQTKWTDLFLKNLTSKYWVYFLFIFLLANFHKIYVYLFPRLGAGVVGIVNVPLEIMEPSHNKQEFLNVQEYNHLLKVMGQFLVQYCKDTGISEYSMVTVRGA